MSSNHLMGEQAEVWKDIPGVSGYQASSWGRIRSLTRIVSQRGRRGGTVCRRFAGRVLIQHANTHGYLMVAVGSPAKCATVHSLVMRAFKGERPEGCDINHKDGNKKNCRPENLEYATPGENQMHALRTGLRKMKVTDDQVEEIKRMAETHSLRAIGRRFGIHHKTVRTLIDGTRKVDMPA